MLHHYLEFMDEESVAEAERCSVELSALYADLESSSSPDRNDNTRDTNMSEGHRPVRTPTLFPSF